MARTWDGKHDRKILRKDQLILIDPHPGRILGQALSKTMRRQ